MSWHRWVARAGVFLVCLMALAAVGRAADRRPVTLDDLFSLRDVSDPQIAPDGAWVAYTVDRIDAARDKTDSDIHMTRWDGSRTVRLTSSPDDEHAPRFSPDGRYLAFLAARDEDSDDCDDDGEKTQIWLLDREGGEALKISSFAGGVSDFVWSPDSRRMAVIARDPDEDEAAGGEAKPAGEGVKPAAGDAAGARNGKPDTPKPIVIDRYYFKEDGTGYLAGKRNHLYLLDVARREATLLTPGGFDEQSPAFSPDGASIVFVSKRGEDFDRTDNFDLYVIEAKPGAQARRLTTFEGSDGGDGYWGRPAWSPDGRRIAYIQGGPFKLIYYAVHQLAVIPAAGGEAKLLTTSLDMPITQPRWTPDGAAITFLYEEDRRVRMGRVAARGGEIERIIEGDRVVYAYDVGRDGRIAFLATDPDRPSEVFAWDGRGRERDRAQPLSRQNDALLAQLRLAATGGISFTSPDGTLINGLTVRPADAPAGARLPTILRIHGGPVGQYAFEFDFDWQLFAAHGYMVVAANPRGSSGRGGDFTKAIYADWGNKDAQDVLAAVDHVVAGGLADPDRLGVGGWSYGGILTNYVIVQDHRFKAATSGAGISNILAGYGTDMYIREYEQELGPPWANLDTWLRLSSPFLHADRVTTPTLFLCGEADFNVPLLNTEQMYQALKSLGVETQLVIYPGENHGISVPSYQRDRLQRYVDWYDRHLKR